MPARACTLRRPAAFSSAFRSTRVVLEVLDADERGGELVGAVVGGGLLLGRLVVGADDQRRSGLVDQDAVGLVDDGEVVCALDGHLGFGVAAGPRKACSKLLRWVSPSWSRFSSSRRKSKPNSLLVP